jgi:hypothetical protein
MKLLPGRILLTPLQSPRLGCSTISHGLLEGRVIEGRHEKLVSKEIFLRANTEKGKYRMDTKQIR